MVLSEAARSLIFTWSCNRGTERKSATQGYEGRPGEPPPGRSTRGDPPGGAPPREMHSERSTWEVPPREIPPGRSTLGDPPGGPPPGRSTWGAPPGEIHPGRSTRGDRGPRSRPSRASGLARGGARLSLLTWQRPFFARWQQGIVFRAGTSSDSAQPTWSRWVDPTTDSGVAQGPESGQ